LKELLKEHRDLIVIVTLFAAGVFFMIFMSNSEADIKAKHNKLVGEASAKVCHKYADKLTQGELNATSENKMLQDARNACFHYMTYLKAGESEAQNPMAELEMAEKTMSAVDVMLQTARK